jgi:hypothetical protein
LKRDENKGGVPSAKPLPNYGRAVFYGLAASVLGGAVWAGFQAITGIYSILMAAAAGWLCGASVKRGMGAATRAGMVLSFYFTAMTVCLGEYFLVAWYFARTTARFTLAGSIHMFVTYYQADIRRLLIMIVFTLTGMVIAMIYSR